MRLAIRMMLSHVVFAHAALGMTMLWSGMRLVLGVGGACAQGGAYEIATPCPDGVVAMVPLGILGSIVALGIYLIVTPGPRGVVALAWPALFVSLGYNFLEFAFDPPAPAHAPVWGWLIPGVVFVVMGLGPLMLFVSRDTLRAAFRVGEVPPSSVGGESHSDRESQADLQRQRLDARRRIQELEELRDQGQLTFEEFVAARNAVPSPAPVPVSQPTDGRLTPQAHRWFLALHLISGAAGITVAVALADSMVAG